MGAVPGRLVAVGLNADRGPGLRPSQGRWRVERLRAPARDLHGRELFPVAARRVTFCEVESPAVVLGSTQPEADLDPDRVARSGLEVARRRSGGGAVLLEPGQLVWADVLVPVGDRLWDDDVGRAAWWVGEVWAAALAAFVPATSVVEVHRGPLVESRWSRTVCFAGLGAGEVRIDGRKVVGVSQRRTRAGALFQCAVLLGWQPQPLVDVLRLGDLERRQLRNDLSQVAVGVAAPAVDVEAALLDALPQR